jgi:NTP pyrophosphatase (non-canonical NTP hydrolase)
MELAHLETACPACHKETMNTQEHKPYHKPNYSTFQPPKDFRQLQDHVSIWQEHNFPAAQPYQPLLGALDELGELSHAHLKAEQGIRGTPAEHHAAKLDAVGDVLVYLADYCNRNGLALEYAVSTAWDVIAQRDWRQFPKNGRTE